MKNSAMINLNGESTKLSVRQLPGEGVKAQYEVCVGEEIFRFTNNRIVSVNFQKEFTIKGETFLFIVYLQEMDVVHNGVLLLRNKPYKKAPTFNLAMILPFLLSVLIPILSLGKAFPIIMGIACAAFAIAENRNPMHAPLKRFAFSMLMPIIGIIYVAVSFDGFPLLKLL